jgi:hypothetical protein
LYRSKSAKDRRVVVLIAGAQPFACLGLLSTRRCRIESGQVTMLRRVFAVVCCDLQRQ